MRACKAVRAGLLLRRAEIREEKDSQLSFLRKEMSSSGASYCSFNRLKRPEDFQKVFSSKQRSADKQFLFVLRSNNTDYARLGLAVPKRHIHKAVERNRIKRVIREAFRYKKQQLKGLDVVVLVRKPIDNINLKGFNLILDKLLEKKR